MTPEAQETTTTNADPKLVVQRGYDKIAQTYLDWTARIASPRIIYLEKLLASLDNASSSRVLELGCGAGIPCTKALTERVDHIVAIDISESQIQLAKSNVSAQNVHFVQGDMTRLTFEHCSLQAVVAFYSVIHLPREEQRSMFNLIWTWLVSGGFLLCNLGTSSNPGAVENWLGSKMYWSSYGAEENIHVLSQAGFTIAESEILTDDEDGKPTPFLWILARKD